MWLTAATRGNLFNFASLLITNAMFLRMLFADSEASRKAYFFCFLSYRIVLLGILSYYCFAGLISAPLPDDNHAV